MRTARLVGLSPDGRSLVVQTDDGDELAIAADDRLRAAVRGDRPRLGQSETSMDTSLSPRDIQSRIRAGESVADVAGSSGMDPDRVERFAAPVLAEREHMAVLALSSSARRRGETSGHRLLRTAAAERLGGSGADPDAVVWDARRREDGRWLVTADAPGETERHAEFVFDLQGRFSVAGNDDGRWLLGESPAARAPQPRDPDAEPTVELDDELALVRATRETPQPPADLPGPATGSGGEDGDDPGAGPVPGPRGFVRRVRGWAARDEGDDGAGPDDEPGPVGPGSGRSEAAEPTIAVVRRLTSVQVSAGSDDEDGETEVEVEAVELTEVELAADEALPAEDGSGEDAERSPLDTLYDMLGGDGYAEESIRVYAGLSDASAVPEVDARDFEPVRPGVDFPVEPGEDDQPETTDPEPTAAAPTPEAPTDLRPVEASPEPTEAEPADPEPAAVPEDAEADATAPGVGTTAPAEPEAVPTADGETTPVTAGPTRPAAEDEQDALIPGPPGSAKKPPAKRKRASVPSWDEIMFGGPKRG